MAPDGVFIMRGRYLYRKCVLALIIGLIAFLLLSPGVSAFFATANPPPRGFRGLWPGAAGNTDVSVFVHQVDDNPAAIMIQTFTGGPINNPQWIGLPPGGQHWVWVVEYEIQANWTGQKPWVIDVEARVDVELWLIRNNRFFWQCTENAFVRANAGNPGAFDSGWIYAYQNLINPPVPPYQQGDIYFLYVYAAGRWFDGNVWWTTNFQTVSLYYLI